MGYMTAEQIIDRAKDKMVLLDNQRETVWHIASIISLHLRRLAAIDAGVDPSDLPRISSLYIAGTGTGKTHLLKTLAKAANCDFFLCDASHITPTGYRGQNLDNFLYETYKATNNPSRWSRSIFLFDEFCKTAYGRNGRDEEYNPQSSFLTMMDGSEIYVGDKNDTSTKLDTSKALFLFSGAFEGIERYVESDQTGSSIGFISSTKNHSERNTDLMSEVTLSHVHRYGIQKELVGRIGSIHYIPPLQEADFKKLICDGNSCLKSQYERLFCQDGISLDITSTAVSVIARKAELEKTGARAASPIIREAILRATATIEADKTINKIIIDAADGEIQVEFGHGDRNPFKRKDTIKPHFKPSLSLEYRIKNEKALNELIADMVASVHEEDSPLDYEPALFYFLQTSLRYLVMCTNPEDQIFASLLKLGQAVSWDGENKSTFDIMICDVFESPAYDVASKDTLRHFYNRFKALEWKRTPDLLMKALGSIQKNWCPYANTSEFSSAS